MKKSKGKSLSIGKKIYTNLNNIKSQISILGAKIKRQFIRPPFPQLDKGEINLHLGCGIINHSSFINIDGLPFPHIHYIRSLDDLSPFKDCSVDLIYACHCLEHFSHNQVLEVLSEWFRVLKPNGILRLSVPDFDNIIKIYNAANQDINMIQSILMGSQNHKYNFHQVIFNRAKLIEELEKIGFQRVQIWQPESTSLANFNDFSKFKIELNGKSYAVSLNVEAIK